MKKIIIFTYSEIACKLAEDLKISGAYDVWTISDEENADIQIRPHEPADILALLKAIDVDGMPIDAILFDSKSFEAKKMLVGETELPDPFESKDQFHHTVITPLMLILYGIEFGRFSETTRIVFLQHEIVNIVYQMCQGCQSQLSSYIADQEAREFVSNIVVESREADESSLLAAGRRFLLEATSSGKVLVY